MQLFVECSHHILSVTSITRISFIYSTAGGRPNEMHSRLSRLWLLVGTPLYAATANPSSPSRVGLTLKNVVRSPSRAMRAYDEALQKHPVTSNFLTGGMVMGLGDLACQRFIENRGGDAPGTVGIDWHRATHAAIVGCLWSGYCSPQVYLFAERLVGTRKDLVASMMKMFITTSILSMPGNYINMSARQMLAGGYRDPGAVFKGINSCFLDVVKADWSVWPAYDFLCFKFIPRHMRGATTVGVNAGWSTYLSFMTQQGATKAVH